MERKVEFVLRLQRSLYLGEYCFFAIERTTRCRAHQKECDGNNGEDYRYRLNESPKNKSSHASYSMLRLRSGSNLTYLRFNESIKLG